MKKNDTVVKTVKENSIAYEAGIAPGDVIKSINGREVHDILEYRFLTAEYEVTLDVLKKNGDEEIITLENDYEDPGIEFETSLIGDARSCTNKCIFCFIDQLPKGMRNTVYFKDDDTRLSFLQGNYVTLTNVPDDEIARLIEMHVSPINISVHTTNPELREKMLGNRFAGKIYDIMKRLAENGITMNCQIVACPSINDGAELERTLTDLEALYPQVNSVSVVPVGLTRYREGLYPLKPFDERSAADILKVIAEHQAANLSRCGSRVIYAADEFYLQAKYMIPSAETYEGFPQIENGVGLIASMREEFDEAIKHMSAEAHNRNVAVATGEISYDLISELAEKIHGKDNSVNAEVFAIKNEFFGGGVNVSGLVTGGDIIKQLRGRIGTEILIIPDCMLRSGEDVFLDDVTIGDVERELGVKITVSACGGYEFIESMIGEELNFS